MASRGLPFCNPPTHPVRWRPGPGVVDGKEPMQGAGWGEREPTGALGHRQVVQSVKAVLGPEARHWLQDVAEVSFQCDQPPWGEKQDGPSEELLGKWSSVLHGQVLGGQPQRDAEMAPQPCTPSSASLERKSGFASLTNPM